MIKKKSLCYRITTSYGENAPPPNKSGFNSKTEKYGIKAYEISKNEIELRKQLQEIVVMIQCSDLTAREKGVIWWIAKNGKLQAYARREKIGKDNVYKIRDRAIEKIIIAQKHKM